MNTHSGYTALHHNYKPHIDGIRSIAVLSVVVYHILEYFCPGGYIGVDIFFVLSGYLITRGILHSHEKQSFTLIDFYSKRIRRIIPAYALLVILVLISSLFILSGTALFQTLMAGRYSALFASNFYFSWNTGYMSFDSIYNPLLHLWSLSVEEQFYLVVPLLMLLSLRRSLSTSKSILLGITIASLLASIILNFTTYYNFNFFMLPTRAWELLAGSLLAYYPPIVENVSDKPKNLHKYLAWLGVAFCLAPMWIYDPHTTFPGLTAIPPVLGTVLLIRYGAEGLVGRILKAPLSVGIGRLSYSLYLWHWPITVYANYWCFNKMTHLSAGVVLLLSFVFAYLSWRFVEMPIRTWKKWNIKVALGLTLVSGIITIAIVSLVLKVPTIVRYVNSYPDTFKVLDHKKELKNPHGKTIAYAAILGNGNNPSYVLLGDSHARHVAMGLQKFSEESGIVGIAYSIAHNFIGKDVIAFTISNNAVQIDNFLEWLSAQSDIHTVVLVNRYAMYVEGQFNEPPYSKVEMKDMSGTQLESNEEIALHSMRKLCQAINEMDKNIIVIAPIPELGFNLLSYYYQSSNPIKIAPDLASHNLDYAAYKERVKKSERILQTLKEEGLIDTLEVETYFFPDKKKCRITTNKNTPFYVDDDHLSQDGSEELFNYLRPQLEVMLKKNAALKGSSNK